MKQIGKSCLTLILFTLTMSAFAQWTPLKPTEGTSQSFVFFDTGEVASVRSYFRGKNPFVINNVEHLYLPKEKRKVVKANYLISKEGQIYTVDAHGYVYHKEYYELKSSIKFFGGNYFITRKGVIHIIRNDGTIIYYDKIEGVNLKQIKTVGGNFFITKSNQLFVIDFRGYYYDKTEFFKDDQKQIKVIGHNYMILDNNVLYTFGTEVVGKTDSQGNLIRDEDNEVVPSLNSRGNKDYYAVVYRTENISLESVARSGGNYFFDKEFNINTIAMDGRLNRGIINRKIKVISEHDIDRTSTMPSIFGNNYFMYDDGTFYMVDRKGYYYFVDKIGQRVDLK